MEATLHPQPTDRKFAVHVIKTAAVCLTGLFGGLLAVTAML